jgi:hypothetical protein
LIIFVHGRQLRTVARRTTKKTKSWGGVRPGAGRPRLIEERADRSIRFERAQLDALEELATTKGVSVADLVREAVQAYLSHEKGK